LTIFSVVGSNNSGRKPRAKIRHILDADCGCGIAVFLHIEVERLGGPAIQPLS
jgi:hypothetical protein